MELLPDFRLHRPDSIAAAVQLRKADAASRFLAGGTDLMASLRKGLVEATSIIDLSAIGELRNITPSANGLSIGAGVTLEALIASLAVARDYPVLAQAALTIAGPTHRAVATVGGNLCVETRCRFYNQSDTWRTAIDYCLKHRGGECRVAKKSGRCYAAFSGDLAPALLVLDATVEIASPQGRRRIPLAEMYADDGLAFLRLGSGELLVGVHVPPPKGVGQGRLHAAYDKVRVRSAIDFPLAGAAVALRREGERLVELRIACTGVGSSPQALEGLAELVGGPLDDALLAQVERKVSKTITAMETTVVSSRYRRRVTLNLVRRLIRQLYEGSAGKATAT